VKLSKTAQLLRYYGLGISTAPLIGSCFYAAGYRISWVFCPLKYFTGIICPSCGMTRSFLSLVRGDWRGSIEYHLFGPILFVYLSLMSIHWIWELRSGYRQQNFYLSWIAIPRIQLGLFMVFIIYYLLRLNSIIPSSTL
jgi:hypothetical protein